MIRNADLIILNNKPTTSKIKSKEKSRKVNTNLLQKPEGALIDLKMQHLTSLVRLPFRGCFGTAIKVSVLYTHLLFQNETLSSGKVTSSTGGFICATSSGTLVMELHALRQCVAGLLPK